MNKLFLINVPPPLPGSRIWFANKQIKRFKPKEAIARVIIADLQTAHPLKNRQKVDALRFFPHFCKVLAQEKIESVFVHDIASLEHNLLAGDRKNILINLIDEERSGIDIYNYSDDLMSRCDSVFNSMNSAKIIRDKKATNEFLSAHGILMPKYGTSHHGRIFSQSRTGYSSAAKLVYEGNQASSDRYNTEYIDTIVQYDGKDYYTCIRIMCIGTRLIKVLVLARDCKEHNPEVRDLNTPQDRSLLQYLYKQMAVPTLGQLVSLGERIGILFGPGFYAHDVLVDNRSGLAYLCETELKFYPRAFMKRFRGMFDKEQVLFSTCNQNTYAQYAASEFVDYIKSANVLS